MEGPYVGEHLISVLNIRGCVLHDGDDRNPCRHLCWRCPRHSLVNIEGKFVDEVYKTGVGDQLNVGSVLVWEHILLSSDENLDGKKIWELD